MLHQHILLLQLGLNHFADYTRDEYRQMLGYRADLAPERQLQSTAFRYANTKPPPSVDWREKGAVTDVKNQEQVGYLPSLWTPYTDVFDTIYQLVVSADEGACPLPWHHQPIIEN